MNRNGENKKIFLSLIIAIILCVGLISVSYAASSGSAAGENIFTKVWDFIISFFRGITGFTIAGSGEYPYQEPTPDVEVELDCLTGIGDLECFIVDGPTGRPYEYDFRNDEIEAQGPITIEDGLLIPLYRCDDGNPEKDLCVPGGIVPISPQDTPITYELEIQNEGYIGDADERCFIVDCVDTETPFEYILPNECLTGTDVSLYDENGVGIAGAVVEMGFRYTVDGIETSAYVTSGTTDLNGDVYFPVVPSGVDNSGVEFAELDFDVVIEGEDPFTYTPGIDCPTTVDIPKPPTTCEVHGLVYHDDNRDGEFLPPGDTAFPGRTVLLFKDGQLVDTEITQNDDPGNDIGTYLFEGLEPGYYTVELQLDVGMVSTSENPVTIECVAGQSHAVDFGFAFSSECGNGELEEVEFEEITCGDDDNICTMEPDPNSPNPPPQPGEESDDPPRGVGEVETNDADVGIATLENGNHVATVTKDGIAEIETLSAAKNLLYVAKLEAVTEGGTKEIFVELGINVPVDPNDPNSPLEFVHLAGVILEITETPSTVYLPHPFKEDNLAEGKVVVIRFGGLDDLDDDKVQIDNLVVVTTPFIGEHFDFNPPGTTDINGIPTEIQLVPEIDLGPSCDNPDDCDGKLKLIYRDHGLLTPDGNSDQGIELTDPAEMELKVPVDLSDACLPGTIQNLVIGATVDGGDAGETFSIDTSIDGAVVEGRDQLLKDSYGHIDFVQVDLEQHPCVPEEINVEIGAKSQFVVDDLIIYVKPEQCDDNNTIDGDGCSASCQLECVPTIEVCDGIDTDCDGVADNGYPDFDGDGIADCVDTDVDGDGVNNDDDCCEFTPAGSTVVSDGCSDAYVLACGPKGPKALTPGLQNVWENRIGWAQDVDANGCVICSYAGEAKDPLENTDSDMDGIIDALDNDDDGDGIDDAVDAEPDSRGTDATDPGTGNPDWWCAKHPGKC